MTIYDVSGIGPPYDRYLTPRDSEPLVPLRLPFAVRFLVLKGKSAGGDGEPGDVIALSSRVARIHAARRVAPMQNVKIEIRDEALGVKEIWGKTIVARTPLSEDQTETTFDVWFTSIPHDVQAVFEALSTG